MTKRLISFLLIAFLLVAIPLSATYKYNPYTRKLDYYERVADADLGDLGDVTLTGLAAGDVLYYDGAAWVNLAIGAGGQFLSSVGGVPAWAAVPAGVVTFVALNDTPANYVGAANYYLVVNAAGNAVAWSTTLLNIANGIQVVGAGGSTVSITNDATDGKITSSTASMVIETTGVAGTVEITGDLLPAADGSYDLGDNTLAWQDIVLTSTGAHYYGDTNVNGSWRIVRSGAKLAFELREAGVYNEKGYFNATAHVQLPNTIANVLSDHNLAAHTALGLFDQSSDVDHNATTNYAANQHVVLPNTIANVLTDHNLAAHTALGLFDASSDVDHNATTNYAANQHVVLPNTIANVLTDHALAAHTAAIGGTGVNSSGFTGYVYVTGGAWAQDATLTKVANGLRVTANADTMDLLLDGTDTFVRWSDGILNLQTDEGVNATTYVDLKGKGAGDAFLRIYDKNDINHFRIYKDTVGAHLSTSNVAELTLQFNVAGDIKAWRDITSGNPDFYWYGWDAGTAARQYVKLQVDATGDAVFTTDSGDVIFTPSTGYFTVTNFLSYDFTTDHNLWVGYTAGASIAAGGQYNTAVGENAGDSLTTGDMNTIVGYNAAQGITTTSANTVIGNEAYDTATAGASNVIIGHQAATTTAGCTANVAIGQEAGKADTGGYNVWVGFQAGKGNLGGIRNIAIGNAAAVTMTVATDVVAIGSGAFSSGTGAGNIAIGTNALNNTTGGTNIGLGYKAGFSLLGGTLNMYLSQEAGYFNQTGSYNIGFGYRALYGVTGNSNSSNIAFGYRAGAAVTTGSNNLLIGHQAAEDLTTGTGNVVLGYTAGESWLDAENSLLVIDNTNTATPLVYGDFANDLLTINGLFGYGTAVDLTIDNVGDVTATRSHHAITVFGGTGSGADDLDTIAGGTAGQVITIYPKTSGVNDTVTVKDNAGNIQCAGDFAMDHLNDRMLLIYNGSNWCEVSRSDND